MIVITGASGKLGSRIVDRLLERVPADQVGVSVRDAAKAGALAKRGVRVREGDFTQPDTLRRAFEDADRVLVVSAAIRGGAAAAANRAALDAARAAGAERVVYTSHQASSRDSLFPPQRVHAETEEHLAGLGIPYTALRNGFYADTLRPYAAQALKTGRLVVPEDGPVSWTAHADLADAAVAAVVDGSLDGVTPPLTAPETLDFEAVAEVLSDVAGRRIERVVADDEEWKDAAVASGMPSAAAEFSLTLFRAARRGEFAVTDPTLETVIGRAAIPVRAVLEDVVGAARS